MTSTLEQPFVEEPHNERPAESKKRFLTPEEQKERIEKIKEQIIDIQQYEGYVHYTQIGNLYGVLTHGFNSSSDSASKPKWGYGGKSSGYHKGLLYRSAIRKGCLKDWIGRDQIRRLAGELRRVMCPDNEEVDIIGDEAVSPELAKIRKKMEEEGLSEVIRDKQQRIGKEHPKLNRLRKNEILANFIEGRLGDLAVLSWDTSGQVLLAFNELGGVLKNLPRTRNDGFESQFVTDDVIPKEAIMALILNPGNISLHVKGKSLSLNSPAEVTINRLNRALKNSDAHLVPLYDHDGNVLWPEYIPYEKVQEIVKEREEKNKRHE